MSKILIHLIVEPNSEYDIFGQTDYNQMAKTFREKGINCPNLGNRLWLQGLISEISCPQNELTYFSEAMTKEYINENFDMIIAPMANIFHAAFENILLRLAGRFEGIRIPVYVIACGVQADSYSEMDDLCKTIKEPATAFMRSVYETGGEFALRGYFSKEFFDRMGFPSAAVTGCPSLYQLGRDLQVPQEKREEATFRPLLNGNLQRYQQLAKRYATAEFFDQERFFHILHDPAHSVDISQLVRTWGYETTKWLLEDRVHLIPSMNDWRNYLQESGFDFSFGSRIHGSIMPILAGIPALIDAGDSRTREMAEFFEIPMLGKQVSESAKSLYEMYLQTDYNTFNQNFAAKFDAYERFLVQHGIVTAINQENTFFCEQSVNVVSGNHEKLSQMHDEFNRNQWLWKHYAALLHWKRRLISRLR